MFIPVYFDAMYLRMDSIQASQCQLLLNPGSPLPADSLYLCIVQAYYGSYVLYKAWFTIWRKSPQCNAMKEKTLPWTWPSFLNNAPVLSMVCHCNVTHHRNRNFLIPATTQSRALVSYCDPGLP